MDEKGPSDNRELIRINPAIYPKGIEPESPKKFWQLVCCVDKKRERLTKLLNLKIGNFYP